MKASATFEPGDSAVWVWSEKHGQSCHAGREIPVTVVSGPTEKGFYIVEFRRSAGGVARRLLKPESLRRTGGES